MGCIVCQCPGEHSSVNCCLEYLTNKLEWFKYLYEEEEVDSALEEIVKTKQQITSLYKNYDEQICPAVSTVCFSTKNI